jgi:hypothetical protein
MRHGAGAALLHGQAGLGAIERLDLALFVDAQHQRLVGRIEIEPDHVLHFGGEVLVARDFEGLDQVRYLHGNYGRGTFTFYGGHDPEDYQHAVGDPPTDLALYKNSPGYRLILNNILFPAATKKKQKT